MLFIITGKTASGKDTLISKILEKYPNLGKVLTTTSRIPRPGEKNGIHYNFISKKKFKQKIKKGDFLEYVEYGGNFYGTEKSRIDPKKDLIWKTDPSWAGKAKQFLTGYQVVVIYITTDKGIILERLQSRGLDSEGIKKRMLDDQKFWEKYESKYDYIIQNEPGKLSQTVVNICRIINSSSYENL
ncbi:hypothetical protein HY384_00590 [Candidatus Daviesbacteria bacterium]|nr:hypothetical protein [Candidatus Daviesbacteria bacterium]